LKPPGLLDHVPVLIADNEPFIALNLAATVQDAGGSVVGPAATVEEALVLLDVQPVAAAILDVNLSDRDIGPVAELLMARGVPMFFHTAVGLSDELSARFPDVVVHLKPLRPQDIVRHLAAMVGPKPRMAIDGGDEIAAVRRVKRARGS
jgi:DNA-binding NarL/FixJ family response regulator